MEREGAGGARERRAKGGAAERATQHYQTLGRHYQTLARGRGRGRGCCRPRPESRREVPRAGASAASLARACAEREERRSIPLMGMASAGAENPGIVYFTVLDGPIE
jgi:hypothetical protein